MNHRILLACLALFLVASSAPAKPNFVVILADDLGYGDASCYGGKDIKTPAIDRLAQEGARLTDCYSAACVCSPTRAALITGRYPQRFGFDWVIRDSEKDRGLPVSATCLAKSLQDAGYTTGLFGKWHLGYRKEFAPNAHGFDQFFGFLSPDMDYYAHRDSLGDPALYENTKPVEVKGYMTDLITDRSLAFLKENAKKPFFLEVAYNAPHWPFQPPDKPGDVRTRLTYGPDHGTRADYVKMVERMDEGVDKLLKALDDEGLTKNTVVVFTSDNGGERFSSNAPFFHGKYTLWEGGIHVPCLVRWPDVIPAKSVSAQPAITMDLTASILSAAGVTPPRDRPLDGEDVFPILSGKKPVRERTFFWRLPRPNEYFGQKAVRRGKWKLVYDREMELLFDLEKDPGERHTLTSEHPEIVTELRKALGEWEKQLPKPGG